MTFPRGRSAVARARQRNVEGWVRAGARAPRPPAGGQRAIAAADRGEPIGSRQDRTGRQGRDGGNAPARPRSNRRSNVSGMKKTREKQLMFFSGRAYPELAEEVATHLGIEITPTKLTDFANGEIYARYLESVRGCDAFVIQSHTGADQQVDHGAADHGGRAQAGLGQADHRDHAVLRLRPAGQEGPRPRADHRAADGRPVQDRRRRPADVGRPAHLPDPGLLRRAGRPPVRPARARRLPRGQARPGDHHGRLARHRPGTARRAVGRPAAAPRWPSSTSGATSTWPTR